MLQIPVRKGSPKSWLLVLRSAAALGADSDLAGVYTGAEELRLRVWPGDDLPARSLPDSGVTWGGTDPVTGTVYTAADAVVTVALADTDTPTLADGDHWVTEVADGGEWVEFAVGTFAVADGPGDGAAGRVYCERDDCTDVCPWITTAQTAGVAVQGSLAEARAAAAEWIDETVLCRFDAQVAAWLRRGLIPESGWTIGADLARAIADAFADPDRAAPASYARSLIQEALDASGLLVDSRVRRAAAHYAVSVALDPLRFAGSDQAERYRKAASSHRAQALALLAGAVLRVDTDADGAADLELP